MIYEIKTGNIYEDFSEDKEMFEFSNYSARSIYYDDSSKLVVGKMKDETGSVAIEEFVRLKQKMYLFLVDDRNEHKKAKCVNKNVVVRISHGEYKDVLLNNECLRYSISRIQSKNHKIGTCEITKFLHRA